jgi:hypothetical protein
MNVYWRGANYPSVGQAADHGAQAREV